MDESSFQFLTEVQKATEISGSWNNIYPFTYEVAFSTADSDVVFVAEYKALTYGMSDQVRKRWEYDYKDVKVGLVHIQLKPQFSSNNRRNIN